MNTQEIRIQALVEKEMEQSGEKGFLVAVSQRDTDHVEVDIQRSDTTPWLRFHVPPRVSDDEVREQIRAALAGEGDLR
jgi:hypothetical protein